MPRARRAERDRRTPAPNATRTPPAAPATSARRSGALPAWLAVAGALAVLVWACRGAPLGVAVADDYSFLDRLAFQKPLDPFDSMGASFYWRPLSRQVYFSLVGPWLLDAPWLAAALHATLILLTGLLVYRIARRELSPAVAAAIGTCVVLSEPGRVLLGWPSGAQHLLAAAAAALAVHEALAGRLATSALAAACGVLSHESAALALPMIPLAAWWRSRDRSATLRAGGVAACVAVAWATGYAVALAHGVQMPPSSPAGAPREAWSVAPSLVARLAALVPRALRAALGMEDTAPAVRAALLLAVALLAIAAAGLAIARPRARRDARSAMPLAVAGSVWFLAGVAPLAALLPDWNAWRSWTPMIGFAVAAGAALGAVAPWLAWALVAIKLVALLASPAAPGMVTPIPPHDGSHVSFSQLVRLQRIVAATRAELHARTPQLPRGASIAYWELPLLSEFAFQDSRALRVWYADSSLVWRRFGAAQGLTRHIDASIEYRYGDPVFAAVIPGASLVEFQRGGELMEQKRYAALDSTLERAARLAGYDRGPYYAALVRNRGLGAYSRGDTAAAEYFLRLATQRGPDSPDNWTLRALLEIERGDRASAEESVRRALSMDPTHALGLELARDLGMTR